MKKILIIFLLLPLINLAQTSFLSKYNDYTFTDGTNTLKIQNIIRKDQKSIPIAVFNYENTLYKENSVSTLECSMCGYATIKENSLNQLVLLKEYRDDFGGVSGEENTFRFIKNKLVQQRVYFYDYRTSPFIFTWIPSDSDSLEIIKLKKINSYYMEQYILQQDSVMEKYEKEIDLY